jgi:hypothetical protein
MLSVPGTAVDDRHLMLKLTDKYPSLHQEYILVQGKTNNK